MGGLLLNSWRLKVLEKMLLPNRESDGRQRPDTHTTRHRSQRDACEAVRHDGLEIGEPQDKNYTKICGCEAGFGDRQTSREPVSQQAFLLANFWCL